MLIGCQSMPKMKAYLLRSVLNQLYNNLRTLVNIEGLKEKKNKAKQKTHTESELARVRVFGIVCMFNFNWVRQFLDAPAREP